MKRFCFHVMLTIGLMMLSISVYAYDFVIEYTSQTFSNAFPRQLYFNILSETDRTVELTFKDKSATGLDYMGWLEIPEKVTYKNIEYTVTTIGKNAFAHCDALIVLKLPETVKYLYCDFKDCAHLCYILGISELRNAANSFWGMLSSNAPIWKDSFSRDQPSLFAGDKKFDEVKKYEVFEKKKWGSMYKAAGAKTGGKWGVIDRRGKTIIPFEYEDFYQIRRNADWYQSGRTQCIVFCVKKNGKWGLIDLANNIIVPFTKESPEIAVKSEKAAFKHVQKNSQKSNVYKDIEQQLLIAELEYGILFSQRQFVIDEKKKAAAALAKAEKEARAPVPYLDSVTQLWGFRENENKKDIVAPVYKKCITIEKFFLVSEDGSFFALLKEDAKTKILDSKYTLSPVNGGYYYFDDHKMGLINSKGEVVLDCIYDDIVFAKKWLLMDYYYIIKDNKWGLANSNSNTKILFDCKYDGIGVINKGCAEVYCKGYSGLINVLGQEVEGIAKTLFNKAYIMNPNTEGAQQMQYYLDVIEIDKETNEGYSGLAYNNIGVIYENSGNRDEALHYYNLSQLAGDDNGKKNFKRLRGIVKSEKLSAVLNTLSQTLQNVSGNSQGSTNTIQNTNNSNSFSGSQGGGNYQSQYSMWERRAESNYRSLTNLGISFKNTKTEERVGSTGQSMNTGNYVIMKKNLREAQNQMRNIRQKAQTAGVTIRQSSWETATVGY